MRGNITQAILQTLADMSVEGVELCMAILSAGYGAPASRIERIQDELRESRLRAENSLSPQEKRCVRNYTDLPHLT